MRPILSFLAGACVAASSASLSYAQSAALVPASANATVQAAGVRPGQNGLRFFNIQGSANGQFASFGVVDFEPPVLTSTAVSRLVLELVQSNASFTESGDFSVYVTEETEASIAAGTSTLRYQGGEGPSSVDPALTNLQLLGRFSFLEVSTGTVDRFDLLAGADPAASAALLERVRTQAPVRLVLVPESPDVAATYAGQGNTSGGPPTLIIEGPGTAPLARTIPEIQGAGHFSPDEGTRVLTSGIVTAAGLFDAVGRDDRAGFFLQDPEGDDRMETSDAVFVVSGMSVQAGDEVEVVGTVEESGFSGELPFTRIVATRVSIRSRNQPLPDPVVLGAGGRIPPAENIDDDALAEFEPVTDGLDFFESLEGMRVTVQNPRAISGTSRFGEIFVVVDDGSSATGLSQRGTLNISPDDFNPEKVQLDPGREDEDPDVFELPAVDVGARFEDVTGVVGYDFGNFQVQPEQPLSIRGADPLSPEVTSLSPGPRSLLVASYNVLNLDPNETDGDTDRANGRFEAIAGQIVNALGTPDVVALQEIQDSSGSANDGTVAADETLRALIEAIQLQGGPEYAFIDNTFIVDGASGGQPGGNIRTAYLYVPGRVELVEGSVQTSADLAAFEGSRLPLIASFRFGEEVITFVNLHLSSKGGSAPIFGLSQPFEARQEDVSVNGSLDERLRQSAAVRSFVDALLAEDPESQVVVLGDMNEFEFVSPVSENLGGVLENLTLRVPPNERYTFNFQGNSQSLDHILVSPSLSERVDFDIVLVNSEFAETPARASDHDPLLALLTFDPVVPRCGGEEATVYVTDDGIIVGGLLNGFRYRGLLLGSLGSDVIAGTEGDDTIYGLFGNDRICGEAGSDHLLGGFGRDILDGGEGTDRCSGGFGRDTLENCEQ